MFPSKYAQKAMILAVALAAPALGISDEAPKWYEKTTVGGFVDAYYKYNFDGRKGAGASTTDKVFDVHQNNFAIGGGKVELMSSDATVDLYFGDYGKALQPAGIPEGALVGQAFISEAFGPVTFTLGRFFTHVGYEVADSVANYNYTRGLLYASVPFYHQGVKAAYSPMEGLGLMVMLDNGNSANYPGAEETAAGAQISYTGIAGLSLYGNYYYQPTYATTVWEKIHFFDFVGSYTVMDGLTVAGEYLYYTQIAATDTDATGVLITPNVMPDPSDPLKPLPLSPKTQGYAIYVDYATPVAGLSITPRFEALYAPDAGGLGDGMTKFDYTLTARFMKGAITNWLEFRADAADDAIYPGAVGGSTASYTEMAVTYAAGYKF